MSRPRTLIPLVLLAALLAGCDTANQLRDALYRSGAEVGNRYCQTRDQALRDDAVARINQGLREEGARFTFAGIACDEAPADELSPQSAG